MHRIADFALIAALVAALLGPLPAIAQQGPGWFIPNQAAHPAAPARPAARPAPRAVAPAPAAIMPPDAGQAADAEQANEAPPPQVPAPPIPTLPALPRTAGPPAVVIGVLGVPEVMRASTAAQEVEKVISGRRQKLAEDAQKEQASWRELQQQAANQRSTLSQDQLRTKEHDLQERIMSAQRQFRDRNRIIQEAAQYSLGQIESTLIAVIRQVSESRGMNLVLHRTQVALNINEFDITDQVAAQLNKVLPSVQIPADGVDPMTLVKNQAPAPAAASATLMQNTPSNGPSAMLPGSAPATPPAPAPAKPAGPASH